MTHQTDNLRITGSKPVISPNKLKNALPLSEKQTQLIAESRQSIINLLARRDPRLLMVVGPCSIHDPQAAIDYAERLIQLREKVQDQLLIVMRVYFEKPRTTTGWKGLINDPHLSDTFEISEGLHTARTLLLQLADMGMPVGTEALDPIVPQYIQELIAWTAIGARTSESQTHREMASGLSTPVGFKNGTNGDTSIAINGMLSAASPHSFLGINGDGQVSVIETQGNPHSHIVLRGGNTQHNYHAEAIAQCEQVLEKNTLPINIMVDASHANASKDPNNQPKVVDNLCQQIVAGNQSIIGAMIESNIGYGNQPLQQPLTYGVSITDACINWQTTEELLCTSAETLKPALAQRAHHTQQDRAGQ